MRAAIRAVSAAGLLLAPSAPLSAQGLSLGVGHVFEDGGWTSFHAGVGRRLLGPIALELQGRYVQGPDDDQRLYGGGLDVSLFRDGAGPFLAGGVAGGYASAGGGDFWGSWSAGGGYALPLFSLVSLSAEARWRVLDGPGVEGVELAAGISIGGGRRGPVRRGGGRRPAITDWWAAGPSSEGLTPGSLEFRRARVIEVAREAMGTRYQFGGTGEDGEGFDCSGLIQYAYGEVGVSLPRVSVDQARAGREVEKDPARLEPGDILTFSNAGGRVTHVGLYLGDGRFIHSATGGVQVSALGDDDPAGRWWWRRWVGVRRVLE
jgi:cell wall-associated NlpC family hydrolase